MESTNRGSMQIEEIAPEIIQRLIADFGGKLENGGKYWQGGRCPACNKKSLWTLVEKPLQPACNHQSKCGYEFKTRDRYADLFVNISERYQPTPENPNATADAYLRLLRGFDLATIRLWYEQANYWNPNGDRGTATVRFWMNPEKTIGWEKFVDKVNVKDEDGSIAERDSRFIGDFKGWCWTPPHMQVEADKPIYLVEGIFDAIALYLNGHRNVIALMTCGNFPEHIVKAYQHSGAIWTLALDNDEAGRKSTLKHIKRFKAMGLKWDCIQPSEFTSKTDWNDLHIKGKLSHEDLNRYAYYGQLLVADSAENKALAMWRYHNKSFFVFDFESQMYTFRLDISKYQKKLDELRRQEGLAKDETTPEELRDQAMHESKSLEKLANCLVDFAYTETNPVDDQRFYTFRIQFPDGRVNVDTMTGTQVAKASDFRKKLLDIASWAKFKGDEDAFEWLTNKWSNQVRHIHTVAYGGWCPEKSAYVFPSFGVRGSHIERVNTENYIRLGDESIKSAYHDVIIKPNFDLNDYNDDWIDDLHTAWGHNGIILLAYFTASLLTTQIRQKQKDVMFLELVGEAGTGKSTLIEFMWKLMGRKDGSSNYEGFDPSASSSSFIGRSLASVSNLPTVFIEADRDESKRGRFKAFDWEELKKLYGGKSPYNRGVATSGNETYAPPYLGSLVVAQNAPVDGSEAVLSRLISIFTRRSETNQKTYEAARRIEGLAFDKVSGYILKCLTQSDQLLALFTEKQAQFEKEIRDQYSKGTTRINFNHAQLCAAVQLLTLTTPIDLETVDSVQQHIINKLVPEREQAIKKDHVYVEQLFRVIAHLEDNDEYVNHYKERNDQGIVAIRLGDIYELARKKGQELAPEIELVKVLKTSRRYIKHNHPTMSAITGKTVRCWFLREKI